MQEELHLVSIMIRCEQISIANSGQQTQPKSRGVSTMSPHEFACHDVGSRDSCAAEISIMCLPICEGSLAGVRMAGPYDVPFEG